MYVNLTYMIKIFCSFLLSLALIHPAHAVPARIVSVIDGDTIDVELAAGGDRIRIRLFGIDAPERKQPGGEAARVFMFAFLFQTVAIEPQGKRPDRYGRTVTTVYLPGGESLQALLLEAGLAWVWPRYCRDCEEWQNLQDAARSQGRGLWASPGAMPPWEWRRKRVR